MSIRPRCCHLLKGLALCCLALPVYAAECLGVVPAGDTAFWRQVEIGAQQAARELDVRLYLRGPLREGGVDAQLQVIELLLGQGCKALVIAPAGEAIAPRVRQLQAGGIPTLYMDRSLGEQAPLGLVATDNFAAGYLAGEHMAQLLQGRGQVALLRLQQGVHSTSERERGFRQGAEAGGLQVLVDRYVGDDSQLVVEALGEQLEQLDGLFTPNSTSSRAALAAMRRLRKAGQRVHIGFDGDEVLLEALRLGDMHALLVQQPRVIGYQSVVLAHQAMQAGMTGPPVHTLLPARLITRANMLDLYETLRDSPQAP